jgi:hypothetical protein
MAVLSGSDVGKIKDKKTGKIVQVKEKKSEFTEYWDVHKFGAANNCALCTAAALITNTKDIDDPGMRKTAGIVNTDLQKKLLWRLGKDETGNDKLEALWQEYAAAHRSDYKKDPNNPSSQWGQWQVDDAFAWYASNQPSLLSWRKVVTKNNYQTLADQIVGLAGYVTERLYEDEKKPDPEKGEKKPVWCVRSHGFPSGNEKTATTALPFMKQQPNGTKFAVITDVDLVSYGAGLHWTYAEKRDDKVTFKDFQMDMEGMREPSASTAPLGPKGLPYTEDNILMLVLAFGAKGDQLVGGDELLKDGWYVTSQ